LFKGSPKEQPHTFDLRGSAFGAWDDNLLAQAPGGQGLANDAVDSRFLKQGIASGFQGAAAYGFRKRGARSQFSFNADGSIQEFASALGGGAFWFHSYSFATGLTTSLTNKTSMSFGVSTAYVPYYRYAPFLKNTASEESPVGSDYGFALNSSMVRTTSASATLENRFSKRSAISVAAGWEQSVIPGYDQAVMAENAAPTDGATGTSGDGRTGNAVSISTIPDGAVERRTLGTTFTHSLTRKLGFHVGYTIQEMRYLASSDARPPLMHNMDVGLGYGDGITLSFGRQTLSLSAGVSVVRNGDPAAVATSAKSTAILVNGSAVLSRPIGRSWGTSLGFFRGTQYIVGFRQPLITDSASAGIGGPLFERLQFSAGAGASRGQALFSESGNVITYTASTRLTFALFTYVGLYGQASYYRFSIPTAYFANFGFVPDLDRRSASVGLTTWLPLIKQRRPRRDTSQSTTGQP